jgi:hypothetical protein
MIASPKSANTFAQATIDMGQSQLLDLSRKATEVSLDMTQAANVAAQSTQDYIQRQKIDLDYQATVISLNIAHAAATQQFIAQETQIAGEATAFAQQRAAAATSSAHSQNITETAQAQAILNGQAVLNAQAMSSLTAYPLTATPFAATQAALLLQQYDREQQSFVDRVVVPLIPIVAVLDLLLLVLVILLAYRRFNPLPWLPRLRIARANVNPSPLIMIDGKLTDPEPRLYQVIPSELTPANPPPLPGVNMAHVELMNASEPPVAHWIAEVEHQLDTEGR